MSTWSIRSGFQLWRNFWFPSNGSNFCWTLSSRSLGMFWRVQSFGREDALSCISANSNYSGNLNLIRIENRYLKLKWLTGGTFLELQFVTLDRPKTYNQFIYLPNVNYIWICHWLWYFVTKIVLTYCEKNFWNSEVEGREFAKFWDH